MEDKKVVTMPSVFSDFCQAWGARFPGSQLPDAWEEDVRANLKKHSTKVAILREELDKEEMYVDYLQTLLKDIERKKGHCAVPSETNSLETDLDNIEDARKQAFLDSHLSDLKKSEFITVINVTDDLEPMADKSASLPTRKKAAPQPPPKRSSEAVNKSRDSLRSVSSPTTPPTSPLISSSIEDFCNREGLAAVNTSSISSSTSDSSKEPLADLDEDPVELRNSEEDIFRGQPDGLDNEAASALSKAKIEAAEARASVRELMKGWEGRPPVMMKPVASRRSKLPSDSSQGPSASKIQPPARNDSDTSSRGRMGSPSGKSHDSSDSDHSWSRHDSTKRVSGETRLDRLVRRPSGEKPKRPQIKPRIIEANGDHLYDTVAPEEELLDEVYDNHLLYSDGTKTDTIGSGRSFTAILSYKNAWLMFGVTRMAFFVRILAFF